jgi:hypothetical protein
LNIDCYAFYGCDNLEYISLPDGIENIGACAFNDTAYYDNQLNWQDGVLYINNYPIDTNIEYEYEYDEYDYCDRNLNLHNLKYGIPQHTYDDSSLENSQLQEAIRRSIYQQ